MHEVLEKEFINAGVQSPSEFEVESDELSTQSASQRTVCETPANSKVDTFAQTQDCAREISSLKKKSQRTLVITIENSSREKESSGNLKGQNLRRAANNKKGMDKKQLDALNTTRTTSDLERRKLEAELKAAEEIAKIKQSVIEKRLELELVSLQDDYNPNIRSLQRSKNELKIFENCSERNENQKEVEQNGSVFRNCTLPPPAPPPPTIQSDRSLLQSPYTSQISSPNQSSRNYFKTKSSKNDCDFLIRNELRSLKLGPLSQEHSEQKYSKLGSLENPLRNTVLPERGRFMQIIDNTNYSPPQQMRLNPFKAAPEKTKRMPRTTVTEAYYANKIPENSVDLQEDPEEPGCSLETSAHGENNSISIWKMMILKMKRKLKNRSPPWQ